MGKGSRPDVSQLQKEWPGDRKERRSEAEKLYSDQDQTDDVRALAYFIAAGTYRITVAEGRTAEECKSAADLLDHALQLFERWPEAHLNRGVALSELGRSDPHKYKDMLKHYEEATNYFGILGADPFVYPNDAALLGKIWLFRSKGRLSLVETAEEDTPRKELITEARFEFEKGREILGRHPEDAACRRWLVLADQIEVELRKNERLLELSE